MKRIMALCFAAVMVAGTRAGTFEVTDMPSVVTHQAAASNLVVRFAPATHGAFNARLDIANDSTTTPYQVHLAGYAWMATQTLSQIAGPAAGGNIVTLSNVPFGCGGADITNIVMNGMNVTDITGQGTNWVSFVAPTGTAGQVVSIKVQSECMGDTAFDNVYTYRPAGGIGGGAGDLRWVDYRVNFAGASAPDNQTRYPTNASPDGTYRWTTIHQTNQFFVELIDTNGNFNGTYLRAYDWNNNFHGYQSYSVTNDWIAPKAGSNFLYNSNSGSPTNRVVITNLQGAAYRIDSLNAYNGSGTEYRFNAKVVEGLWSPGDSTNLGSYGFNPGWPEGPGGYEFLSSNAALYVGRYISWTNVVPIDGVISYIMYRGGGVREHGFLNAMRISGWEGEENIGVVPSSGPYTGEVVVTISGSNLCSGVEADVLSVTLCGVEASVTAVHGSTQIVVSAGYGGFGLGDVVVRSVEYGTTIRSNAFTYQPAPSALLRVRGNGLLIENNASADPETGTDFGSKAFADGQQYTNTFVFRNEGNDALTISGWTTNGFNAEAFEVRGMPGSLPAGASSNVLVVFTPLAESMYSADIEITHDAEGSPFVLNLAGMGVASEQTITFPAIGDQVVSNEVGLAATSDSGLEVRFEVSGVGLLSDETNLTFSGYGSATVTAIQDGNEDYAYASTSQTFHVTRIPVTFEATGLNLKFPP